MSQKKAKRITLGEGESFGHKHVLESAENISYDDSGDSIQFMLASMGVLTHDEHDRMVFEPGKYRSYNQVEFNPFDQSVQRVFD